MIAERNYEGPMGVTVGRIVFGQPRSWAEKLAGTTFVARNGGWLIMKADEAEYLCLTPTKRDWTDCVDRALRFARREDAEAAARFLVPTWATRVVSHHELA